MVAVAAFGDVFSVIGVREPQAAASEAFVKFADAHRNIEKFGIQLLKTIKPVSRIATVVTLCNVESIALVSTLNIIIS